METRRLTGTCFCGDVEIEVTGDPVLMCYCHCRSCRHWLGAPLHGATVWPQDHVRVLRGRDKLAVYKKTDNSHRTFCTHCGGHVWNAHPGIGAIDVMSAMLPDLAFAPTAHVHYQESVLPIRDGLPKFRDMPSEYGGSGQTLPE